MLYDGVASLPQLTTQWSGVSSAIEESFWPKSLRDRLSELSGLRGDWDSYDSPPISPLVIELAADVLSDFSKLSMPSPELFPVGGGGIQLEWEKNGCELELEILPTLDIEYLIVERDGRMAEGRLSDHSLYEFAALRDWFLTAQP